MDLFRQMKIFMATAEPAILIRTNEPYSAIEEISKATAINEAATLICNPINSLLLRENRDGRTSIDKKQAALLQEVMTKEGTMPKEGAGIAVYSLSALSHLNNQRDDKTTDFIAVMIFQNMHLYMRDSPKMIHAITEFIAIGKTQNKHLLMLVPPSYKLPPELDCLFAQIDHELPQEEEYKQIIRDNREHHDGDDDVVTVAKAARGLTRLQFETALSSCIVQFSHVNASEIWKKKVEIYNQEGLLEIISPTAGLDSLSGMAFDKEILLKLIKAGRAPKVMKVGPPGVGKTRGAECIGFDTGLPVLSVRLDAVFGKYVGESEERTRILHAQIERNSPCICILDELPRFLSTDGNSATTGSGGVDAKVGGQWLTWLSSPKAKDVIIIATANQSNNVQTLVRAQRFDFVTYTSIDSIKEKRDRVWDIYCKKYDLDKYERFDEDRITPAEQEQICKIASWLQEDIVTASLRVTRVIQTMSDQIKEMEAWGTANCIDNETGFRFGSTTGNKNGPSRRQIRHHKDI